MGGREDVPVVRDQNICQNAHKKKGDLNVSLKTISISKKHSSKYTFLIEAMLEVMIIVHICDLSPSAAKARRSQALDPRERQ